MEIYDAMLIIMKVRESESQRELETDRVKRKREQVKRGMRKLQREEC